MRFSVEKLAVIGIGAIGAYAVYRLLANPGGPSNTFDQSAPIPPPPITPDRTLPLQPGALGTVTPGFPLVVPVDGAVRLLNSRAYRGRLELAPSAGVDAAVNLLAAMGFEPDSIQIFSSPGEARRAIPDFALAGAGQGTRWFHARWTGPTASVARPRELRLLWTVAGSPARV